MTTRQKIQHLLDVHLISLQSYTAPKTTKADLIQHIQYTDTAHRVINKRRKYALLR